ncbi:hypothetical protein [Pseudolabrys sp.]|uniref:hypothetical protein n=1 Tax=Pseudolabrys sp. TaxID=1960880 RepID=UPI003D0C21E5
MTNVIPFSKTTDTTRDASRQPCVELIEYLEHLLDAAHDGRLQGVAAAELYYDESTNLGWAKSPLRSGHTLFAAVGDLQWEMAQQRYDARRPEDDGDAA